MNLPKLTFIAGAALAVMAFPMATAHAQRGGGGGRGGAGAGHVAGGAARGNFGHATISRGGTRAFGHGYRGGYRGNGHGYHRGHRRGYYPYYAYDPFFYGSGFGFGYGYPYYGTSGYYSGDPGYYSSNIRAEGSVGVAVQQELARQGFYRGPIDGVIGSGTRSAIRAYERANRLPSNGRISGRLLDAMGIG
ncbi:MAG: peptidoglycan-binding domain-containing protein [Chthoniobacterales bacterium]